VKITILTAGSRGDVYPYVALGEGLVAAGHDVRLATYGSFGKLVENRGLEFYPFTGRLGGDALGPAKQAWKNAAGKPLRLHRALKQMIRDAEGFFLQSFDDSAHACRGSDAIIASPFGIAGPDIARSLAVPFYWALLQPMTPTREYPHFLAPGWLRFGGAVNAASYHVADRILRRTAGVLLKKWRSMQERTGAAADSRSAMPGGSSYPTLYAFSPAVLPAPQDWSPLAHVTGYWFLPLDKTWSPGVELEEFIASGEPPVYIKLEQLSGEPPETHVEIALEALRRTRMRGILAADTAVLDNAALPESVLGAHFIPYEWLMPRVAAAVHHGGHGTTAAALQAGTPSVVVPRVLDQPFWSRRVAALQAGPAPIPRRRLTPRKLASAIDIAARDHRVRGRAEAVGCRIRNEHGVEQAVASFHHLLTRATG
jgi:UDP:flavonoid glycosyltransferase YjiC (YdhE family)